MRPSRKYVNVPILALGVGILVLGGMTAGQAAGAQPIPGIDARVVAINIPGASAIAQIGTFLNVPPPVACANPILQAGTDRLGCAATLWNRTPRWRAAVQRGVAPGFALCSAPKGE